jgi:hypothetical protein
LLAVVGALAVAVPVGPMVAQAPSSSGPAEAGQSYRGAPVDMGQGVARVLVRTDTSGAPQALGVELTPGVLEGLPDERAEDRSLGWHRFLAVPPDAPETGFNHVMINWHPEGHHPQKIYGVPHFDFHFYLIDWSRQLAVRYPHPQTPDTAGVTPPSSDLVPAGYVIPPATHVNEMGLHALPEDAPELHGKPFVHTFMYGYVDGELAFLEPMVTRAFLASRSDHVESVERPEMYGHPGHYPTRFRIEYDEEESIYRVMLEGLRPVGEDRVSRSDDPRSPSSREVPR